ncbi:protein-disulfide reductase DsbD family protein [Archangium sp.]|uniref:protein-disulfide reductase DsbD family protein n=1 Tax=Archangium sp. TaxID=1872627 RepID=UPI002D7647A8|nr:thioredoxin family protein [Archangium sp.]HYO57668.1 thioredoxin family protein [Archangium sp.]
MAQQRVRRSSWGGLLFTVLGLCLGSGVARAELPSTAVARGAPDEGNDRVEAALLMDVAQVKPGDSFRVGVRFRMDPGWHIYWKNPGESGLASEVSWDTPGTTVGELQWPAPSTFRTSDGYITTYGYADEVLLFAEARASEKAVGSLQLSAAADVLVCEVHCLPAQLMLTRGLAVGPETRPDSAHAPSFDAARARVPVSPESSGHAVTLALDAKPLTAGQPFTGTLTVTGPRGQPVPAVEKDFFVPERIPGIARLALAPVAGRPGTFKLEGEAAPDVPPKEPRFAGVLRLGPVAAGSPSLTLNLPLAPVAAPGAEATPEPKPPAVVATAVAPESSLSLGLVLLFAFLGGALLNLMPCVFPVLALKAYGFTRTVHAERGQVGLHALAYAGGIVGSLLVLAVVVLALRAGGSSVGWGFQFQEPLFVAAVAAVLVAFALNLFGLYTVGTDGTALVEKVDASHGFARSAGEGVLAVVLATPCSAPLLGTAVGFALAAGPATVLVTFFMLGLGLALPFCLLVLVPGLTKFLPKPGAWMERGKQLLGFALLGTTVWLVWVMGGLTGVDGMARLLAFLAVVGLGAWLYGLVQGASGGRKAAGVAAVVVVLAVGGVLSLRFEETGPAVRKGSAVAEAQPWDEAAVAEALKAGQPVFIDFTADWCLTCKFNERTVLAREEVRAAFAQHKVAFFVADWTRRDERISAKLAGFGRAGVPMYMVVSPAAPDKPEVLSELLTPDSVIDAVRRAAGRVTDAT